MVDNFLGNLDDVPVERTHFLLLFLYVEKPVKQHDCKHQDWETVDQSESVRQLLDCVSQSVVHPRLSRLIDPKHVKQVIVQVLKDVLNEILGSVYVVWVSHRNERSHRLPLKHLHSRYYSFLQSLKMGTIVTVIYLPLLKEIGCQITNTFYQK